MIIVFYDGKCGLCRREIEYYKNITPIGLFNWVDVTKDFDVLKQHHIDPITALKHIHVLDQTQKIQRGADAFIVIWTELKGWRWLAKFLSLPMINFYANKAYNLFAWVRFTVSPHCRIASIETKIK